MDYNIYIIIVGVNLLLCLAAVKAEYCNFTSSYNNYTMYMNCSTGCCGFSNKQYCCSNINYSNESSMISLGALIGICIGAVALFFLVVSFIVAICCCCCICCKRPKEPDGPEFQIAHPAVAVYYSPEQNPDYNLTGNVNGETQFQPANAPPGSTETNGTLPLMTERTIP